MALRVGTIQKAFQGVETKYGAGRIYGRFGEPVLTEPRASAAFLHLTLEQSGTDFGPLFGHPTSTGGPPDPTKYGPDAKLTAMIGELAQAWAEAKANAKFDSTTTLHSFI